MLFHPTSPLYPPTVCIQRVWSPPRYVLQKMAFGLRRSVEKKMAFGLRRSVEKKMAFGRRHLEENELSSLYCMKQLSFHFFLKSYFCLLTSSKSVFIKFRLSIQGTKRHWTNVINDLNNLLTKIWQNDCKQKIKHKLSAIFLFRKLMSHYLLNECFVKILK